MSNNGLARIKSLGFGLLCDSCGGCNSHVIETRPHAKMVIRKRRCACGQTFLTYEVQIDDLADGITVEPQQGGLARKLWRGAK